MPRVFVVVAVEAQQLPVAAVKGIVVMVVILVMDREFTYPLAFKFPSAPGAKPWVHLKRSIPITLLPLFPAAPGIGNDLG